MRYRKVWKKGMVFIMLLSLFVPALFSYADDAGKDKGQEGSVQSSSPEMGQELDQISSQSAVRLTLDNQNRYAGMEKSYSEGYMPMIRDGGVYLVAPILADGPVKGSSLSVSLNLGAVENTPFIVKNYERSVPLQQNPVGDGSQTVEGYLADFFLELASDRCNGSYPVTVQVRGTDGTDNEILQEFIIYVTITDGKLSKEEEDAQPSFVPKLMVQSCQFSKTDIQAGDEITAEITLVNTSKTEPVRNLTVTAAAPAEQFTFSGGSDVVYIDTVPAGGTTKVAYLYQINAGAPRGQYDIDLTMDYADSKGNVCSGTGKVKILVEQPVHMQFDPLSIATELEVADVAEARIQVMNLGRGRVYNVRAVIAADGLTPQGTLFIGDMEPGSAATANTQITVSSLSGGDELYGKTEGTVTYYFQDEAGREQTEVQSFQTTIQSPFTKDEEPEDEKGQWWVIMAVIGGLLAVSAAFAIVRKVRQRRENEEMQENEEAEEIEKTQKNGEVQEILKA